MMHPDQMYQLRQLRNQELLIEAEQARIMQELVRNQRQFEYDESGTSMLKLTLRYVLSSLAAVGFAINWR